MTLILKKEGKKVIILRIIGVLTFDKAAFFDMCILYVSKNLMYDFHYILVIKYNYCLQTLIVKYMKLKENFCFNKDIFDFVECQDNSRM